MHWWEETERRALRTRGGAALAITFWQRLREAGCPEQLALLPAQALASLHGAAVDLVHWVDGLLTAPESALETQLLALRGWCRQTAFLLQESERPFLFLLDGLRLDPEELPAGPEEDWAPGPAMALAPEEAPKWEGRYRQRHLLYERLDIRMEALGLHASLRRPLCHSLASVYEEFLVLLRRLGPLAAGERLRFGQAVRLLTDVNATFHLDLGPRQLSPTRVDPGRPVIPGLATWLDQALAGLTPGSLPPEWFPSG